jgi:hypothetical protein
MLFGCAGGSGGVGGAMPEATAAPSPAPAERPLAGVARSGVLLFPAQRVELANGLAAPPGGTDALLRQLDAELAFAVGERGLGSAVAGASVAERLARTNPTYAMDPRALPLSVARPLQGGDEVQEPLASQLRAVSALADRRHAVVPVVLRLEPGAAAGSARATLRLALVDVRLSRVLWAGATEAVEVAYPSAAVAPRTAARFADLLVAPREP